MFSLWLRMYCAYRNLKVGVIWVLDKHVVDFSVFLLTNVWR